MEEHRTLDVAIRLEQLARHICMEEQQDQQEQQPLLKPGNNVLNVI